jgi:hypothetical protein
LKNPDSRLLKFEQQAIGLAENGRPKRMTRRNNGMLVGQYSNVPIWLFQQAAIATVVLAVMTAACGAPSTSRDIAGSREIVRARGQLDDHMADCTKRYGYDPEAASKLGSNVLGSGEREWRGCVYQGIEKYLIPRTQSPDVYRQAIVEDRKMTEAVANGEMTRAQRQARVQQMLEEIDRIEEANQAKLERQTMSRLEVEMRQDMMRRSLSPLLR